LRVDADFALCCELMPSLDLGVDLMAD